MHPQKSILIYAVILNLVCAFSGSLPFPSASLACAPSHPQNVCMYCQGWRWLKHLISPSADLIIRFLCETPWLSKRAPDPFVSCQRPLESSSDSLVASTRPSAWRVGTDVQSVMTCAVWTTSLRISSQRKKQQALRISQSYASKHMSSICKFCETCLFPVQRVPPHKCLLSFNQKYHSWVVIGSQFT